MAVFNAEFCLVSLKVICDDLLGHPLPLLAARFEHAAPDCATYAEHFNARCTSGHGQRLRLRPHWLDQPLPLADVITHQAMAERCRKQNTEFTGRQAWLGRIRQLLSAQLNARAGLEGWRSR
jgi:hypothetical protein